MWHSGQLNDRLGVRATQPTELPALPDVLKMSLGVEAPQGLKQFAEAVKVLEPQCAVVDWAVPLAKEKHPTQWLLEQLKTLGGTWEAMTWNLAAVGGTTSSHRIIAAGAWGEGVSQTAILPHLANGVPISAGAWLRHRAEEGAALDFPGGVFARESLRAIHMKDALKPRKVGVLRVTLPAGPGALVHVPAKGGHYRWLPDGRLRQEEKGAAAEVLPASFSGKAKPVEEVFPVFSLRGPAWPGKCRGLPPTGPGGAVYVNDRDQPRAAEVRALTPQEVFALGGGPGEEWDVEKAKGERHALRSAARNMPPHGAAAAVRAAEGKASRRTRSRATGPRGGVPKGLWILAMCMQAMCGTSLVTTGPHNSSLPEVPPVFDEEDSQPPSWSDFRHSAGTWLRDVGWKVSGAHEAEAVRS